MLRTSGGGDEESKKISDKNASREPDEIYDDAHCEQCLRCDWYAEGSLCITNPVPCLLMGCDLNVQGEFYI